MTRSYFIAAIATCLLAASNPLMAQEAKPKSNFLARAKVLSKNELSITIKHSEWGQQSAYQFASDHCASFGKIAVPTTSNKGYGPDNTTTWICQEIPKPAGPQASESILGAPR